MSFDKKIPKGFDESFYLTSIEVQGLKAINNSYGDMYKMDNFKNLVNVLKLMGYSVIVSEYEIYSFASIKGKGIIGGFCSKHDENHLESNYYLNGKICVDNVECFDKWRNCALQYFIPETESEVLHLLNRMNFWGSKKGEESSNDFEYDEMNYED